MQFTPTKSTTHALCQRPRGCG